MFPARFAPILFGFILSGIMSCVVSGISTLKATGTGPAFPGAWMNAWSFSWPVAFCIVIVAAPLVRRLVARLTRSE